MAEITVAKIAADIGKKFLGGIVDAYVDGIKKALGFNEATIEEKLAKAFVRFADVVDKKLDEQWHEESIAILASITQGVVEFHNSTREIEPNWWEKEWALEALDGLSVQARDLIKALEKLELLGWETFFLAVGQRLRILATLDQMPDRTEKENIDNLVRMSIEHHHRMCGKLRNEVVLAKVKDWVTTSDPNLYDKVGEFWWGAINLGVPDGGPTGPYPRLRLFKYPDMRNSRESQKSLNKPGYYLPILVPDLLGLMRKVGTSDNTWLSRMPPVRGVTKDTTSYLDTSRSWEADLPHGEFWFWCYDRALYMLQTEAERDIVKQRLYNRKRAFQYWIWSHYVKGVTAPLHDVTFEWLEGTGLVREIKPVAIRTSFGTYVSTLSSSNLHDWEARGQLESKTPELEPGGVFRFIRWADGRVSLYAPNQQFVAADQYRELDGTHIHGELVANKDWVGEWERFRLRGLGQGRVAFKASNGRHARISLNAHGRMVADLEEVDEQFSAFELIDLEPRKLEIDYLECLMTEDQDGVDGCLLNIYVDGRLQETFKRELRAGDKWRLPTRTFTFWATVEVHLLATKRLLGMSVPWPLGVVTINRSVEPRAQLYESFTGGNASYSLRCLL